MTFSGYHHTNHRLQQSLTFITRIQPTGTVAPSSNPCDRHIVLDPLIQILVAQTKANASRPHNHLVISP